MTGIPELEQQLRRWKEAAEAAHEEITTLKAELELADGQLRGVVAGFEEREKSLRADLAHSRELVAAFKIKEAAWGDIPWSAARKEIDRLSAALAAALDQAERNRQSYELKVEDLAAETRRASLLQRQLDDERKSVAELWALLEPDLGRRQTSESEPGGGGDPGMSAALLTMRDHPWNCRCLPCVQRRDAEQRAKDAAGDRLGPPLGWHVISGKHLLAELQRVEAGEKADIVFAELWANADHERIEP